MTKIYDTSKEVLYVARESFYDLSQILTHLKYVLNILKMVKLFMKQDKRMAH